MSQLNKLIESLCPYGVGTKKVESLLTKVSVSGALPKSEYKPEGLFPIVNQAQNLIAAYSDDDSKALPNGIYIVFGDHTRAIKWVNFSFIPGESGTLVFKAVEGAEPKYLYYALKNLRIESRGYNRHWTVLRDFNIPLPPIEVQKEIVEILDKFTQLEAELEAELEARKTQYSEFLKNTFNFHAESKISWAEIGEVCSTFSGAFVKKTKQDDNFEYPVFNGGSTATGRYSDFNSPANSIAISARGSIGAVNWVPTKFWAGNSCHVVLATDPRLNNRFLYHYLKFQEPSLYALRAVGSIPALNLKPLLKFMIPIPTIEVQAMISQTLDKFEALINDISVGLPAEIRARRQQYEYYRSKLLTFKELDVA